MDQFIDDVFGNILDLRECNRRLLEVLYVRQREQAPVIKRIGDVFLGAATEFRLAYPIYIGHLPLAEKRMKDEAESNPEFRLFLEVRLEVFSRTSFSFTFYQGMLSPKRQKSRISSPGPQALLESTIGTSTEVSRFT